MAKSSTSVSTGSITSTAEPATSTTANGTTVILPNEAPPAELPPAGSPPATSQVDPHSALPSVATTTTVTTAPVPAAPAPAPSVDFQQALEGARRALTGAQEETIELRRKIRQMEAERNAADAAKRDAETRAALQAVQTASAPTVQAAPLQAPTVTATTVTTATPASPPAPPFPASAINMTASLWGAEIGSSGWRIVLSLFVPLLASFAMGSLVYELATIGVTAVATVSGFFLWPLLILVLGAIAAVWMMYKTFGIVHGYIDSGKAEAHWHTVWGWLSSPLRVVETQDEVRVVGAKVDRLLLTQGVKP